jgi:hypothetical protein
MYGVLDTEGRYHNCNETEEMIVTKSCELLLDAIQFVGFSSLNRVPNKRGVFKL